MFLTEKFKRPNKYAGKCPGCGRWVESEVGCLGRDEDSNKWLAVCKPCSNGEPVVEDTETTTVVQASHPLTEEQALIVTAFNEEGLDIGVQAGAGTGKTSTLVAIANSTTRQGQYVAFNKDIVVDSSKKMPKTVSCNTAHSLAFAQVGKQFAHRFNTKRIKSHELAKMLHVQPFYWQFATEKKVLQPGAIAGYVMRAVTTFCNSADPTIDAKKHLAFIDGIDAPDKDGKRTFTHNNKLQDILQPVLERAWADLSDPNGQLPFSQDVYLKVWQLGDPVIPGDYIMFDESQDASPVMLDAVVRQRKQTVYVGDSQQQIYEWRGAVNALDNLATDRTFFLTHSFRFGQGIADVANAILAEIPSAKLRLTGRGAPSTIGAHDKPNAVLCRSNAGAIGAVIATMDAGLTACLVGCEKPGNEISRFVNAAATLIDGRRTDHADLACFASWKEVTDYVDNDPQGDDLKLWVKLINDHGIAKIKRAVNGTVSEADADVIVSTAHKSKGREWDVVTLSSDFKAPKEGENMSDSELRLLYVAATRARKHLDYSTCGALTHILGS